MVLSEAGELSRTHEDAGKHDSVEAARVGVAQRRVIAAEESQAVGESVLGTVTKGVVGAAIDLAAQQEVGKEAVPSDFAQADDYPDLAQRFDLGGEMSGAVPNLLGGWLVSGWGAADDGGDPGMAEAQAVVAGYGVWLSREAELVEYGIHEVAGAVAGEGPAGAVGSMSTGREAENQDAGLGVSEARDGPGPVGMVDIGAAASFADASAVFAESWAELATGDGLADAHQIGREWES
jgi:hypothetical protein